jgi:hypothetical protein
LAIFKRRSNHPKKENNYRKYYDLIREDFSECCAYCLIHEILGGGKENYELDHYRPKSLFSHLINDFLNIYYSCHVCNLYKSDSWPSSDLERLGYCFVDPCNDDFSKHFSESNDGRWLPITNAGRYTEKKIRLNRVHLIEIRGLLRRIAEKKGTEPINWNVPIRDQIKQLL